MVAGLSVPGEGTTGVIVGKIELKELSIQRGGTWGARLQ